MLLRIIAITLVMCISVPTITAALPDAPSESKRVEDTKKNADDMRKVANSFQLSGKTATVTLKDKSKTKGQITTVTENGFLLKTREGQDRQFSFADVQKVSKSGMSTGTKILIGVGVGLGTFVGLACAAYACRND